MQTLTIVYIGALFVYLAFTSHGIYSVLINQLHDLKFSRKRSKELKIYDRAYLNDYNEELKNTTLVIGWFLIHLTLCLGSLIYFLSIAKQFIQSI